MPVMLVEANLRFARLEGAMLHGARLDGADVSGARIDPGTLNDEQRRAIATSVAFAA